MTTPDAPALPVVETPATVGRVVHYQSHGSADGTYPTTCRAAIITEVDAADWRRVGLCVLNPAGVFFRSLADGGSWWTGGDLRPAGSWHWPERV